MRILIAIPLVCLLLTTYGCATAVDPSNRDLSGQYKGRWDGSVDMTRRMQERGTTKWTCQTFSMPFAFEVRDGYVNGSIDSQNFSTPVGTSGKFAARVPGRKRWIFHIRGRLDAASETGKGYVMMSLDDPDAHYLQGGCEAEMSVTRA